MGRTAPETRKRSSTLAPCSYQSHHSARASALPPHLDISRDDDQVLAIAYHNVGVEQEFLKKYENSIKSYRTGVEVAERYLGPEHAITTTLRNSCVAARRAIVARDPAARLKEEGALAGKGGKKGGKGGKSVNKAMLDGMMSPRPDGEKA